MAKLQPSEQDRVRCRLLGEDSSLVRDTQEGTSFYPFHSAASPDDAWDHHGHLWLPGREFSEDTDTQDKDRKTQGLADKTEPPNFLPQGVTACGAIMCCQCWMDATWSPTQQNWHTSSKQNYIYFQDKYILKVQKANPAPLTFPRLAAKAIYNVLFSVGEHGERRRISGSLYQQDTPKGDRRNRHLWIASQWLWIMLHFRSLVS